jgi:hypothetical protein
MAAPWIGERRLLVIPTNVIGSGYDPPPDNWKELVDGRINFDPDSATGIDRSVRAYIHAISYGQAELTADIADPITVPAAADGSCRTVQAIQAHPTSHLYEYACVVFMSGNHPCGGQAIWDTPPIEFNPPRSPNLVRARCRVRMNESLGVWAMEILHIVAKFGDLYNTSPHPDGFDEMACSCGTHPSIFTKLAFGWLKSSDVLTHFGSISGSKTQNYTLHAIGLTQPAPSGRITGVRIPHAPNRVFWVEARLRADAYEKQTIGVSSGIPSEGVVVYESDPQWPLQLRTATALVPGKQFESTQGIRTVNVKVDSSVAGGFKITVKTTEHVQDDCDNLRARIKATAAEIVELNNQLQNATVDKRYALEENLRAARARLTSDTEQAIEIGCVADDVI